MGEGWNIALVGATGAVGEAILELLQERDFPIGELTAIASEDSIGKTIRVKGKSVAVQGIHNIEWADIQLAFLPRRLRLVRNTHNLQQIQVVLLLIAVVYLRWSGMYL